MRHQISGKKLSLDRSQRKALFKNLISALVIRGAIRTTEAKAKAIRGLVDRLITEGKAGTFQARRKIAAFLQNKVAVKKIVDEIGPLFRNRPGGFTRMVRLGQRRGDNAMEVRLELVENPKKEERPPAKKPVSKIPLKPTQPRNKKRQEEAKSATK